MFLSSRVFIHNHILRCLYVNHMIQNLHTCSSLNYSPAEHTITGDVNIIKNDDPKLLLHTVPFQRTTIFKVTSPL